MLNTYFLPDDASAILFRHETLLTIKPNAHKW